jgi:hypothetical protein
MQALPHSDLDLRPPKIPFDRFWVVAARLESGHEVAEYFFVVEVDLPNDKLGPVGPPPRRTEQEARDRLAELGLGSVEVTARIEWARKWMATTIVPPGQKPRLLSL